MNNTIIPELLPEITEKCFKWCQSQHFANDFQNVWILMAIFLLLGFALFMRINGERFIKHSEMTDDKIAGIIMTCVFISFCLLLAFLVMWKYF